MRPELDPLVTEYQHDVHRHRASEALHTLQKIASLVKPVMRQRNWHVGTLCEFYPEQPNLLGLNINRGQKICLRLRYPGDERQFLPIEEVTDTMLHELCHIVHGPHDEAFHALWGQLRDEHEALVRKGYTGEGFLGAGRKLGGSGTIPKDEARRRARVAAEKRRALTAGSGQKVGGRAVMRGEDIRRVIADAAQRRMNITKGCASETEQGNRIARDVERNVNGFRTKAEEDDANERAIMQAYIDMIQEEEKEKYGSAYVPPSESNPAGMRAAPSSPAPPRPPSSRTASTSAANPPAVPTHSKPQQPPPQPQQPRNVLSSPSMATPPNPTPNSDLSITTNPPPSPSPQPDDSTWPCPLCTLLNPSQYLACDACGTERPHHFPPSSPSPSSTPQPSRPAPRSTSTANNKSSSNPALKPRLSALDAVRKFEEAERRKEEGRPMGWVCGRCGNWMEREWWVCGGCGEVKDSS
ncbi:MAG: hypothetical protein Q9227_009492 [Pyrenula ochraceoflavens]